MLLIFGTTVGAGVFSLPIALQNAGAIPFILIAVVVAYLTAQINILYRRVIEHTGEKHQLPGYAGLILGRRIGRLAVLLLLFATAGALLAYLILGGGFLSNLLGTQPEVGSFILAATAAVLLFVDGHKLESIDGFLTIAKIGLIIVLGAIGLEALAAHPSVPLMGPQPFLAYGTILFAMTGFSIMPELHKTGDERQTIALSQILIGVLYVFFAFSLYPLTSGGGAIMMDSVFKRVIFDIAGLCAVFTPYLLLGVIGVDIFVRDLGLSVRSAKTLMVCIPLLLFALGLQSFTKVLSLTGGVFLGGIAIIIASMYAKTFPRKNIILVNVIRLVFIAGLLYEIVRFFAY